MTTGRGFISLAAMIFGKWTSVGALGSALLFGFAEGLGVRLQLGDVNELQALTLLIGVGLTVLGLIWVIRKIIKGADDKRSVGLVVGFLAVGIIMVLYSVLGTFSEVEIPIQFLGLLPYILTILVLAGFVGRAHPPEAIGKPYEKQ
jgi:simple sugar transport system permease protein